MHITTIYMTYSDSDDDEIKVCSRQEQKSVSAVKMCNEMASEVFLNFRKLNLTINGIITGALQSTMFLTAE